MNEPVNTYDLWEKFNSGALNVDDEMEKIRDEPAFIRLLERIEKRNKPEGENQRNDN